MTSIAHDTYHIAQNAAKQSFWHKDFVASFHQHLQNTCAGIQNILAELHIEHLIIGSGKHRFYHRDDVLYPFRTNPNFRYVCPMPGAYHLLHFSSSSSSPTLAFHAPINFWHLSPNPENHPLWHMFSHILVRYKHERFYLLEKEANIAKSQTNSSRTGRRVFLGYEDDVPEHYEKNPKDVENHIAWMRMHKTSYEMACLIRATHVALKGHMALSSRFLANDNKPATERDLYYLFESTTAHIAEEFVYPPIIAMDHHSSTLHYEHYDHYKKNQALGVNLLVDAGCSCLGYSSDISRTTLKPYTKTLKTISGDDISKVAHDTFSHMLTKLGELAEDIIERVMPNQPFTEYHNYSAEGVGHILKETNIIKAFDSLSPEEKKACIKTFYPHGVGHMLGLTVHDVNVDKPQKQSTNPKDDHTLRLTKKLHTYNTFTIEPGIYFIPFLIEKLKSTQPQIQLDDALIKELTPLGGMRIEDNIFISDTHVVNVTRDSKRAL